MTDFQKKVIYQIYPKSFYDTTGSGTGDLKGVTAKLDYLQKLGVDYIWLTPFFVSPQNDNGYDIADYYNIDPSYGTMADVEELIAEAKKRNIYLMFDMVFNHVSTESEWFKKALTGDKKYMDYFFFKDGKKEGVPPTNWQSKFGGPAWEYVENLDKWYLHLFDVSQADLNWENPELREEVKNVVRFWMKKGVSGFRFDVVNLISKPDVFEDDNTGDGRRFYTDGPRVHQYLQELCREAARFGIRIILDGVFSHTGSDSRYFNREGRYGPGGAYRDRHSPYRSWYDFDSGYKCGYRSWWGFETLPEVQEAVCKCAKEYIALIGPEAKSAISGSPARFHLAKNGKVTPPRVSTFRNAQEKGRPTALYRVFSHASGAEFDSLPPTFSLYTICSSIRNTSLVSLWNA